MATAFKYDKAYCERRRAEMDEAFSQIEPDLKELSEHLSPRTSRFLVNDANKGVKKSKKIIDSTPLIALRNFCSGMQSGCTSAAMRWFKNQIKNPQLRKHYEAKLWCSQVEELMRNILLESNFYECQLGIYDNIASLLFGCLSLESDYETVVNFKLLPVGSYRYSKDHRGEVDTLCRMYKEKATNLVKLYGENNCSEAVRSAASENKEVYFEVVYFVEPNKKYNEKSPFSVHKRFISVTYELGSGQILKKSGFDRFPFVVFEAKVNGEDTYPTSCPGVEALPDVKQLNTVVKEYAKAAKKISSPAYKGPANLKRNNLSDTPGSYFPEDDNGKGISPVYEVPPTILQPLAQEKSELKQIIKEHFYNDLFAVILNTAERGRTATEVNEVKEEKMVMLSPLLDQVHKGLRKVLEWIFHECDRVNILPPPPEILQGENIEIEFVSTLAQAQKVKGIASVERFTTFVLNLSNTLDPVLKHKLVGEAIIDGYSDIANIPPEYMAPNEKLDVVRQAMAAEQEQAKQMAAMQQGSEMIKNVGGIDAFGGDLMSRMGVG